ncbi:MAG: NAD-dependent epimerase/dehydratase family protein [Candidatus Nanohaloarchaea archaeon]|nr:NAD-dependent epimerase/dehydratase family protein [Candidatus Nanohaloarchaea archaeon]
MDGKEIVVTGGAGFIGSHLVDALVDGNAVTVIDDLSTGREEFVHDDAVFEHVDIRDFDALTGALGQPDIVFHLAASAHTRATSAGWDDPVFDAAVNARGTLNVLRAVRNQADDARVVFASSAAVYGNPEDVPMDEDHPTNPISPYGIHKLAGEKYMAAYHSQHGIDTVSARIFNTFGPRQPRYVMYDFLTKLQQDPTELEVLGTGRQTRDYCYIDDTVDALLMIAEEGEPGEPYNLSGENVISIGDLAELMVDMLDLDADIHYTEDSWKGDPKRLEADISRLKHLGFEPAVELETGLEAFIDWFEGREGAIT